MPKRSGVTFIEQDEPAFLKRFKAKVGYQEPASLDDKLGGAEDEEEGHRPIGEDEKPQVVVLKTGDLTAEQAAEAQEQLDNEPKEEDKPFSGGKIVFKRPEKEAVTAKSSDLLITSSKEKSKDKIKQVKSDKKAVKNKCLLSFDDEEEEED